jgi:nickel/cobalt transporter (NiCoT) family protein
VLFTAGMCLLDTADGSLMMALYTQTAASRDPFIILYYSIVLTAITVLVALVIGTIQVMTLIVNVTHASGPFADGITFLQDHWDIVGKNPLC